MSTLSKPKLGIETAVLMNQRAPLSLAILKGEAKANAVMKAETKAKRRVTLSICGMGWVDESEIDSIPNARRVDVDISRGDIVVEVPIPIPKKGESLVESVINNGP